MKSNAIRYSGRSLARGVLFLALSLAFSVLLCHRALAADVANFNNSGLTATYTEPQGAQSPVYSANADSSAIDVTVYAKENKSSYVLVEFYSYDKMSSTLTITNNSNPAKNLVLTYRVEKTGSNGSMSTSGGTVTIPAGKSVEVATLSSGSRSAKRQQDTTYCQGTFQFVVEKVEEAPPEPITLTLNAPPLVNGAVPGEYTAKAGTASLEIGKSHEGLDNTVYTFEVTSVAKNRVFDGWYTNGTKVSDEKKWSSSFQADTMVEPRFLEDPLLTVTTLSPTDSGGEAITGTKTNYVEISSAYSRGTASYYSYTKPDNSRGTQYFADPVWTQNGADAVTSSCTVTAQSEAPTNSFGIENVHAYAMGVTPVIRIKALDAVSIQFDYSLSMTNSSESDRYANFYYYVSTSDKETASTIASKGTDLVGGAGKNSGSATEVSVSLNKDQYLYFYGRAYYHNMGEYANTAKSWDVSFNATLSNIKVTKVNEYYDLTTGMQDNVGVLAAGTGKVTVNNTAYTVTNGADTKILTSVSGTALNFSCTNVPSGYALLGWKDVTNNVTSYTTTYSCTLNQNTTVYALVVPAMTIQMGNNGYTDATYTYGNGTPANGQYVARSGDGTEHYTTLKQAFDDDAEAVVLLAGHTFKGNFTIPDGEKLVIPYAMDDPGRTETAGEMTSAGTISYYCTATVDGELTVNGTLVVSARQYGGSYGRTGGAIGRLNLSDDSTITVGNGGHLNVFGLLYGDQGHIDVLSGGTVCEIMDMRDMRGPYQLKNIWENRKDYSVFPLTTFFVRSIESNATYHAGASLNARYCLNVLGDLTIDNMPLIGSTKGMFILAKGSMSKSYDRAKDQTVFFVEEGGEAKTGDFSISARVPIINEVTIDTTDYVLPLCHDYCIDVAGTLTFVGDYKMLPGASVNVFEGGTMNVGSSSGEAGNMFFYCMNDYDLRSAGSSVYQGFGASGYPVYPVYFPSVTYNKRPVAELGSATLNVDGTLNAYGGLYVTDGVSEAAVESFAGNSYDNGYNNLTGTGKIVLHKLPAGSLNEARQDNKAENVEFVDVPLSAIKGNTDHTLTADDGQTGYTAFEKGSYYGALKMGNRSFYVWGNARINFYDYDAAGEAAPKYTAVGNSGTAISAGVVNDAEGNYISKLPTAVPDGENKENGCIILGWADSEENIVTNFGAAGSAIDLYAVTGHTYVDQVTPPTCTEGGYTTHICSNADCGHSYTSDEVAALGHTEVTDAAVAPTCDATGLTEGKHCSVCNVVLVAQTVVNATGHNYVGAVTTAPTCTTAGVRTYTCQNDSKHTYTESIPAAGHSWNEGTVTQEATCGHTGTKTVTCTVCGATSTAIIPATGKHTWEGTTCTVCDASSAAQVSGTTSSGGSGSTTTNTTQHVTLQGAVNVATGSTGGGSATTSVPVIKLNTEVTVETEKDEGSGDSGEGESTTTVVQIESNNTVYLDIAGNNVSVPIVIEKDSTLCGINSTISVSDETKPTVTVSNSSQGTVAKTVLHPETGALYVSRVVTEVADTETSVGYKTYAFENVSAKAKDYYVEARADGSTVLGFSVGFRESFKTKIITDIGFELYYGKDTKLGTTAELVTKAVWLNNVPEKDEYFWTTNIAAGSDSKKYEDYTVYGLIKLADGRILYTTAPLRMNVATAIQGCYEEGDEKVKSVLRSYADMNGIELT